MNLLVTGGQGQLGRELIRAASGPDHRIHAAGRDECDITNREQVDALLDTVNPDVLINCAAYTKVDAAEAHAEDAYRVNAIGPRVLATACAARDILIVHVSTDYVFGSAGGAVLDEWTEPVPNSVYGASKLAGENEVRAIAPRHQIVRTAWLFGQQGPNFVLTMLRLAREGRPVRVVHDQVGSPTWTGHLAPALLRLATLGVCGTYHLTNAGEVSWHGLARAAFAAAGRSVDVAAISTDEYPTAAPRPAYSALDNRAWRLLGEPNLPPWQEGVSAYVRELLDAGALSG